jgi:hypothetical protein
MTARAVLIAGASRVRRDRRRIDGAHPHSNPHPHIKHQAPPHMQAPSPPHPRARFLAVVLRLILSERHAPRHRVAAAHTPPLIARAHSHGVTHSHRRETSTQTIIMREGESTPGPVRLRFVWTGGAGGHPASTVTCTIVCGTRCERWRAPITDSRCSTPPSTSDDSRRLRAPQAGRRSGSPCSAQGRPRSAP